MDRIEKAEQVKRQLYGEATVPLKETDPEFAAIKERLVYGEVYTDTGNKLGDKLRELVILAVATANQTIAEIKRHT